jgi:hypothetical protein
MERERQQDREIESGRKREVSSTSKATFNG